MRSVTAGFAEGLVQRPPQGWLNLVCHGDGRRHITVKPYLRVLPQPGK